MINQCCFSQSYQMSNVSPDILVQRSSQVSPSSDVYMKRLYTVLPHFNDKSPIFQMSIILYSIYSQSYTWVAFWTSVCLNQPKKDSGPDIPQKQPLRTVKTIISSPTAGRGQHPCH